MRVLPRTGRLLLALVLVLGSTGPSALQHPPEQLDGAAILHRMQKLGVLGSVLYVAAHPDDENTRLISYLANGPKARTAYLSLTRGDGGQNLIGPELGDALGVLRTQELVEARRIDGGEQFFTRAVDFGYSKSPEETLAKWGREAVLADVVRVVRTFRPDVIVTRFATDGSGRHGQHTASALLAHEAYALAADPEAFPEQLAEGLEPWQVQRVFFNASTWWNPNLPDEAAREPARWVTVDVGGYDPLLGASYTEIAGRSRSQHKSQGFGAAETRGSQLEYLRLDVGPELTTPGLFNGMDTGWTRVAGGEPIGREVRELVASYDPLAPEESLARLTALVRSLDELASDSGADGLARGWARHHADAARELVLQVLGLVVEAGASEPLVAQGETLAVTLSALQRRGDAPVEVLRFDGPHDASVTVEDALGPNRPLAVGFSLDVAPERAVDQPYWLAEPHDALYRPATIDGHAHLGIEPESRATSLFRGTLRLGGLELAVERPLVHTWVDRVDGQRSRPAVVTPVASIEPLETVVIVTGERVEVAVELAALTDELGGTLSVSAPAGWTVERSPGPVGDLRRGERRRLSAELRRTPEAVAGPLRFSFAGPRGTTDRTLHVIDYPHIRPQVWYSPAEVRLVPLDVEVSVARVGYVEGAGDDVPRALERLGVDVELIDPGLAQAGDLADFDAIVTGIRAYNTVPAMRRLNPLLLDYVADGGTLVVQYNTAGRDLVLDPAEIGPHPFALTRGRVTVEEAPVTFLAPEHPLMTTPNRLGPADFDGWVQERGLYFAGAPDPAYATLFAWSDPGEEPLAGALIACDHGRGRFVYTGISLFRQLPAGVPGAYRLLANLLARRGTGE